MDRDRQEFIRQRIARGHKRQDVFSLVPEGSSKILEIGYGDGALLLRLKTEKRCTDLYGIEVDEGQHRAMEGLFEGNWNMFLGEGDNHLDESFLGYFDWIIMHDVLEHMYDPWYFLAYVQRYCHSGTKMIFVCPNAQYWQTIFSLLHGDFPYGQDGYFNEDHIRWFTPGSMMEMALLSGLRVEQCQLLLSSRITPQLAEFLNKNTAGKVLPMPPLGFNAADYLNITPLTPRSQLENPSLEVLFKGSGAGNVGHLSFYAVKIALVCSMAGETAPEPVRLKYGLLKQRRKEFFEGVGSGVGELLPKEVSAHIWQPG